MRWKEPNSAKSLCHVQSSIEEEMKLTNKKTKINKNNRFSQSPLIPHSIHFQTISDRSQRTLNQTRVPSSLIWKVRNLHGDPRVVCFFRNSRPSLTMPTRGTVGAVAGLSAPFDDGTAFSDSAISAKMNQMEMTVVMNNDDENALVNLSTNAARSRSKSCRFSDIAGVRTFMISPPAVKNDSCLKGESIFKKLKPLRSVYRTAANMHDVRRSRNSARK